MKNANPVSRAFLLSGAILLALAGCRKGANAAAADTGIASAVVPASPAGAGDRSPAIAYGYEVIHSWPHDRGAFTQGLVYVDGRLFESTGLNGESSVREVDLTSGRVLRQTPVAQEYFAEGLALLGNKAYQLTWKNQTAFVYDRDTFKPEGRFSYTGEGWGLTTDGKSLILSDGSAEIRFLDPATFAVQRTIYVTTGGLPVRELNELEWIHGEIFANVWQTNTIVRIDPATGHVTGTIDFSGLLAPQLRDRNTDVLNGIAYDEKGDRLFITGKRWPLLFEVRLKAR